MIVSQKQPRSKISRIARPTQPEGLHPIDSTQLSRYDILLAIIPLALLAAWIVGQLISVPNWVALGIGALIALPAVIDGLAVNPPV